MQLISVSQTTFLERCNYYVHYIQLDMTYIDKLLQSLSGAIYKTVAISQVVKFETHGFQIGRGFVALK